MTTVNVIKIDKALPKRKTFICDICGCEIEETVLNPVYITKNAGDFMVQATVCNKHFGFKDGKIVYTLDLLKAKFEVENKADEILANLQQEN